MVHDTKYYDLLEISPTATPNEIKKAYNLKAKEYHPDRNRDPGAEEIFKQISKAYTILSNPETRSKYDQWGEKFEELSSQGPDLSNFSNLSDLLNMFGVNINGMNGMNGRSQRQKGPMLQMKFMMTLKEVYFGVHKKLVINRNEICTDCTGTGLKTGKSRTPCSDCQGRGYKLVITHMGQFIQQVQTPCSKCGTSGVISKPEDLCSKCKGERVLVQEQILEVTVPRGAMHGQKIVFSGESHRHPDYEPNDLVVILLIEEHPLFHRDGLDLHYSASINLIDALTETILLIPHVNGDLLYLKEPGPRPPGSRVLKGYGLPSPNDQIFGDLIIDFTINYPKELKLTPEQQ